jgi:hypothetical protein
MQNLFITMATLSILLMSSRCKQEPSPTPTPDGLATPKLVLLFTGTTLYLVAQL